jgi:HK97 family phage major capsid protein
MGALADLEAKNANVYSLFQSVLDEEVGPVRESTAALQSASAETKQYVERLQAEMKKQADEIKALKTQLNRPSLAAGNEVDPKFLAKERKNAFNKACRWGWGRLSEEEKKHVQLDNQAGIQTGLSIGHGQADEFKALYQADGTTGGFLATPEIVTDLIKSIVLVSPMPDIVDMRTTANPYISIFKRTQTSSATRVAEQATRGETTNPKFGLVQVFPYEAYALCLISITDLDDSELDLGQFIMDDFAVQFAKLIGNEFINGQGAAQGQALGFLQDTTITATPTVSQASGKIDYQTLVKLKNSLKTGYRSGATWVFTTETLGEIQSLTDSQNRPLWAPFGGVVPDKLFGYNYVEMPDMPQTVNNGGSAGALAIAFGNFKVGYQGVVRKQVSIQVLKERYIDQNAYGYMGWYRFGGQPKLSEAIKVYSVKA